MTEEEAKTKWCPFVRLTVTDVGTYNRGGAHVESASRCIASACMAWRRQLEHDDLPVGITPEGDGWVKKGPAIGFGGAVTHRQSWKRAGGYCGLAGAPQ